ncbi:hypothetical protein [Aequorivita capsosiphonis]|uniref:hypothetical protein n=1 Tax=Aequorivita capsosiphonis TaxID=487317 RepID=UPI0004060DF7|nr:hypothetical protein [Aequorivita capsosiphonis]
MKTTFLTFLVLGLGALSFAQETPIPPKTPTTSTTVSTSTSSSSNYVKTVLDDKDGGVNNLNVAISETDNTYKLRAKFNSKNDSALKEFLLDKFGEENLKKDGSNWKWKLESGKNEVYVIKFSSGSLKMELDKSQASNSLTEKFVDAGEEIKELISEDYIEQSEGLQRKADRLQKVSDKLRRKAERSENRNNRELSDHKAQALKAKSEILQRKVDSLQNELRKLKED